MTVEVRINGKAREVAEGATLLEMLAHLQVAPERVVIEQNREIVRREQFAERRVRAGDELELVFFVGGG
jgi:sulfur carrier protein